MIHDIAWTVGMVSAQLLLVSIMDAFTSLDRSSRWSQQMRHTADLIEVASHGEQEVDPAELCRLLRELADTLETDGATTWFTRSTVRRWRRDRLDQAIKLMTEPRR